MMMWPIRPRALLGEGLAEHGTVEYTLPYPMLSGLATSGCFDASLLDRPWRFVGFADVGEKSVEHYCACQQAERLTPPVFSQPLPLEDEIHTLTLKQVRAKFVVMVRGVAVSDLWVAPCPDCPLVLWLLPMHPLLWAYATNKGGG